MHWERRSFLAALGTAAVAPFWAREAWAQVRGAALRAMVEQQLAESLTEPFILEDRRTFATFEQAMRLGRPDVKRRVLQSHLPRLERSLRRRGARINPWPADKDSIDYRHLLALGQDGRAQKGAFTLNHGALQSLAKANGYASRLAEFQKVAFGLRGCQVVAASAGPQRSVRLKEARPDHVHRRCVLGVWDRVEATVAVYEGSTVPDRVQLSLHRQYVRFKQKTPKVRDPGVWQANLLPQGLYDYRLGTHLADGPSVHHQPGALLQMKPGPVLRAHRTLSYRHDETWDYARYSVGDNIHASMYLRSFLEFSSMGCQTVYGRYWPPGERPTGPWQYFRVALGIDQDDAANRDAEIPYMLTTGREARIHAYGFDRPSLLNRIRYGSRGFMALQAQRALKKEGLLASTVDGKFGRDSAVAVLEFQKRKGLPRDAVITPKIAAMLGLSDA
ncbi:MAG: peptidoglycan-binding domain-containing protein [Myxococcota bacterium]